MSPPSRRVVITISAGLTLGWSALCLAVLYAGGMALLRMAPAAVMEAASPLLTAAAIVGVAAGAGLLSITGIWLFGGPMLHALEVIQADQLAKRPQPARPLPDFREGWLRLSQGATLLLLPAALGLLFLGQR